MSITINGTGSITGLTAGGLPDGSITADDIASGAVTAAKLAAGAGGKILQVVSATKTDAYSSSGTTWTDIPGLSSSITVSASSRVYITGKIHASVESWSSAVQFRILRGSTDVGTATGGSVNGHTAYNNIAGTQADSRQNEGDSVLAFYDSALSAGTYTYKIQARMYSGTSFYKINAAPLTADDRGSVSTITLMEVAA